MKWQHRPFPDANLLLLEGRDAALVDSGFVGHADETTEWVNAHTDNLRLVVNTHWHSDHVGGNAVLQSAGAAIAGSSLDAQDLSRLADAARLLSTTPEDFAADLLETMLGSGAIQIQDGRLHAAAEHSRVPPQALQAPFPRAWLPARSIPSSQVLDRS